MNLSKSPLRRAAGLAAGVVVGLAGVAVAASPAYATGSTIGLAVRCDTAAGDWAVDWTITGHALDDVNKFRFKRVDSTVGDGTPGGEQPNQNPPFEVTEGFVHEKNTPITATQKVSGDKKYTRLTVVTEFDNGHKDLSSNTAYFEGTCDKQEEPKPEPSSPSPEPSEPSTPASESPSPEPSSASPTPSASETPELPDDLPGNPKPIFEVTCDTMTIGFDNPEDSLPIKLHYKTSKGEERDLTIAPGTKDSETFSATEGFSVDLTITVTYKGETYSETVTLDYTSPGDCEDGEGGGLPVTGAAAGGVAAGAAGLLAIGALLFFMARRRKVKFTA